MTRKTPVALKREEAFERDSQLLPGLEFPEVKMKVVRSDGFFRYAEQTLAYILGLAGYHVNEQIKIGRNNFQGVKVDMIASLPSKPERRIVISSKWYRTKGSFDEKIPTEVAKLTRMIPRDGIECAYVVISGPGIKEDKRKYWCNGGLDTARVKVIDLNNFMAEAFMRAL